MLLQKLVFEMGITNIMSWTSFDQNVEGTVMNKWSSSYISKAIAFFLFFVDPFKSKYIGNMGNIKVMDWLIKSKIIKKKWDYLAVISLIAERFYK